MSTLLKNTLYLTVASVAQKVIAFVYFTLVANTIGKASQGDYFLALSVTTILTVVSDWGLSSVLIREVAKTPSDAVRLVRSTLGLKIPLILLAALGSVGLALLLHYDRQIVQLVAFATLILAADAISLTFFGVLRGLQNLRYESLGIFVGQILTATFGLVALQISPSLTVLIFALILGSVWNAIFSATRVAKHLGWRALVPAFDPAKARQLMRFAFAFAMASLFVKVYSYIDSIFLKQFIGGTAVGTYSIAYKITYAFQFLPMAFVGGLYPALAARFGKNDKEGLRQLFDDAIWYTGILAVPIVFGIASLASIVVPRLYPTYLESIGPLQILIFVLLPLFLDFPIGSLLNAAHRQNTKAVIMGCTMVVSVVLNALLIPRLGIPGASVSAVVSFSFMMIAGLCFVPRIISYSVSDFLRRLTPIFLSGLLMLCVVLLIKSHLPVLITIGVGGGVYVLALFLSKAVTGEHLRSLRHLFRPSV